MKYYEVYSPSRKRGAEDIGLTLEAPNWMAALRDFLTSLGEDPDVLAGMMCDAQDNVRFHLTFPNSNRWFRIVEVQRDAPEDIHIGDLDEPHSDETITGHGLNLGQITEDSPDTPSPPDSTDPQWTLSSGALQQVTPPGAQAQADAHLVVGDDSPTAPMLIISEPTEPSAEANPQISATAEAPPSPADLTPPTVAIEEPAPAVEAPSVTPDTIETSPPQRPPLDEILEKIFERSTDLMEGQIDPDLVVSMFLDLALDLIACEAGALYVADISSHELSYAALRSPRAQKVLASGKKIRMGEGMAGLSAQEGRTLCFDELKRFPDYFEEAAFLTGLEPRNSLCVPLEYEERSYGSMQLVNRLMVDRFEADDIAILEAIGAQVAVLLGRVG